MERWDDSVSHRQLFEDLTELTLMAEAGGFGTVWIGEHHSMEYTISPSPMPQLAYLAARTSTIRLGAGTIIAPFWNPIRVAGECALLDVISNGRAEIGLARGAYQFEFDRMAEGISASSGGTHLREMVPAARALWQGDYAHDIRLVEVEAHPDAGNGLGTHAHLRYRTYDCVTNCVTTSSNTSAATRTCMDVIRRVTCTFQQVAGGVPLLDTEESLVQSQYRPPLKGLVRGSARRIRPG